VVSSLLLAMSLVLLTLAGAVASTKKEASPSAQAALPAAAAPGSEKASLGIQATSRSRDAFEVFIIQYWALGARLRAEAVVRGHNVVTVVNGEFYYAYDALTNAGYRIRRPPEAIAADSKRSRPFALQLEQILSEGGEKIRDETIEGIEVEVYRVTNDEGRRTLWVQKESSRIPIRLEAYDRATGSEWRLDWINWVLGVVIPESYFKPPSEVKLEEFESYDDYRLSQAVRPVPPGPPFFPELIESLGF
jgi:outer membrane lipoprotein-sorting protein